MTPWYHVVFIVHTAVAIIVEMEYGSQLPFKQGSTIKWKYLVSQNVS